MASIGELTGTINLDGTQAIASLSKISGLLGAGLGIAGIGLTVAGLIDLGRTAENVSDLTEGLGRNFDNVTQTMKTLRASVQGAVSDINLIRAANEFATKGISNNAEQIGAVWQLAQVRAKELGMSTTEAFDQLEAAILRPAMLNRLYNDVPKALKTMGTEMGTAAQRAEALNFVMEKGADAVGAYAEAGISIVDPWEQFDATLANLKQQIALSLGPLLVQLAQLVIGIAKAIGIFIEKNKQAISAVIEFAKSLVVVIGGLLGIGNALSDTENQTNGLTESMDKMFGGAVLGAEDAIDANNKLSESLQKIQEDLNRENYEFNKSLDSIIKGRKDQVDANRKELEKQTADFNKSQNESKKQETQKTSDMRKQLSQRIEDLRTNMTTFLVVGSETYEADLAKYQEIIDAEKAEGERKIAEQETMFAEQTDAQQKEFDDRTAALKASIKEDEDFLLKHAEDVKAINKDMLMDEIDELKNNHALRLAEISRQNLAEVAKTQGLSNDIKGIFNSMPKLDMNSLIKWPDLKGAELIVTNGFKSIIATVVKFGFTIAEALFAALIEIWTAISRWIDNALGIDTKGLNEWNQRTLAELRKTTAANQSMTLSTLGLTGFAQGTSFAQGGMAIVGEKGPEIVNIPRGSQVIPNNEINDYSGRTITINNFIDKGFDVDAFNNRLNFQLRTL